MEVGVDDNLGGGGGGRGVEVGADDNSGGTGSESEREKIEGGREPIKLDLELCTAQSVLITRS